MGLSPVIFEKSRGIGGRLATRRTDHGDAYDHGAQFVTARDPAFVDLLANLQQAGAAAEWLPRLPKQAPRPAHTWWIGASGMSSLLKPLAASLDVRLRATVSGLRRHAGRWELRLVEQDHAEHFDAIVITAPAPQARALLAGVSPLVDVLERVDIAPCWAAMLGFDAPLDVPFEAARFECRAGMECRSSGALAGRGPDADASGPGGTDGRGTAADRLRPGPSLALRDDHPAARSADARRCVRAPLGGR
ncbi:MAG: hypothetical protein ABT19_14190 [Rhodanobacter sp. SCN 68-63]|nr:MAG: hypothetical protein ABT19_14190 [Rhodanobacter sp. SCN 68-63]